MDSERINREFNRFMDEVRVQLNMDNRRSKINYASNMEVAEVILAGLDTYKSKINENDEVFPVVEELLKTFRVLVPWTGESSNEEN